MRIGYACINNTLAEGKVQVNRSMIKKTFQSKGISYASELALNNIRDLEKVITWNLENGLLLYRMSSDMFPWMSEYELSDLPDYNIIKNIMTRVGAMALSHDMRLTFHPGPFNVLASPNPTVVTNTIKELRQHAEIMDLLGMPVSSFSKINIHIGGVYKDKESSMGRFMESFSLLPGNTKQRLTIENDDKPTMFSISDLIRIHKEIGIPVVFDYLHHSLHTGGLSEKEAMLAATETWPESVTPVVHYSSSKKRFEDPKSTETAHADYIYERINLYGKKPDIMLEAKAKEKAVLKYIKEYRLKLV